MKIKSFKYLFIIFFGLGVFSNALAQKSLFSGLKSNEKRADLFYENFHYQDALDLYELAFNKQPEKTELILKIARCYASLKSPSEAVVWYSKLNGQESLFSSEDVLNYAHMLSQTRDYEKAQKWFNLYYEENPDNQSIKKLKERITKTEKINASDTSTFFVEPTLVSSSNPEFSPAFVRDQGVAFISAKKGLRGGYFDIYYSELMPDRDDPRKTTLSDPIIFDKRLNTSLHEGPLTFSENLSKVIFTRNIPRQRDSEGVLHLGLFEANAVFPESGETLQKNNLQKIKWQNIRHMPFNNKEYSVCNPTLSRDGKTLYFSSNMPGGYGGFDIYKSEFIDAYWTQPENLGSKVNTEGDELYPFIFKGQVLYFASDGHLGLGGLDIFKIGVAGDSLRAISTVQNMKAPINSSLDDFGLIIKPDGYSGFFSSNRKSGGKDDDIYSFYNLSTFKKKELTYKVSGVVLVQEDKFDPTNRIPLGGVDITLIELITQDTVAHFITSEDGKFAFDMSFGGDYKLICKKESFEENPATFNVPEDESFDEFFEINFIKDEEEEVQDISNSSEDTPLLSETEPSSKEDIIEDIVEFPDFETDPLEGSGLTSLQVEVEGKKIEEEKKTVLTYSGVLINGLSDKPMGNVQIQVLNTLEDQIDYVITDEKGRFEIPLEAGTEEKYKSYTLRAVKEGFTFDCFKVEVSDTKKRYKNDEPFKIFDNLDIGKVTIFNGLTYNTNSEYKVNNKMKFVLEEVASYLKANPTLVVELGMHTSTVGDEIENQEISKIRALHAADYLVKLSGINPARIYAKGYGESIPVSPCVESECDEENKKLNERIEIKVVSYMNHRWREFLEEEEGIRVTRLSCNDEYETDRRLTIFRGKVVTLSNHLALDSAEVYFYNIDDETVQKVYSNLRGEFEVYLQTKTPYIMKSFKQNFRPSCQIVNINKNETSINHKDHLAMESAGSMSLYEQFKLGFWGELVNYTSCLDE